MACMGNNRPAQKAVVRNKMKETHCLEDISVNGMIILKLVLKK